MIKNCPESLTEEKQKAFSAYNVIVRSKRALVAHILIMILMPLGIILDYFVYPNPAWQNPKLLLIETTLFAKTN